MAIPATRPEAASPSAERPRVGPRRTAARRLVADRAARWAVTAGGIAIIASVLGILLFILVEVWPLSRPARVAPDPTLAAPPSLAVAVDEHRTHALALGRDGRVRVLRLDDGRVVVERPLVADADGRPAAVAGGFSGRDGSFLAGATVDGRLALLPAAWEVTFDEAQRRSIAPRLGESVVLELDPQGRPLGAAAAVLDASGAALVAAQLADGTLVTLRRDTTENLLTGEVEATVTRLAAPTALRLRALVVDADRLNLYGGAEGGQLAWWSLEGEALPAPQVVQAGSAPISALSLLIGDRSLVVGQADGALSVWFPVRQANDSLRLTRIRDFPRQPRAVALLAPSRRNKGFLAADAGGGLGLYHSTAHRTLWRGKAAVTDPTALAFAPKGDGALVAAREGLQGFTIVNPHPEVTPRALFGRVWYEGYERPDYTWQSTGGTDDFEPKLSLTPLLVGTLKGTLYSLLLAIPLGVFGAMYASQFMHPSLLRFVKPMVEVMAVLPSVVLGFLAGLWLAPRVERAFPGLLLMVIVLPAVVLATGALWRVLPRALRSRVPTGSEIFLQVVALALAIWACLELSPAVERLAFGGSFQRWLQASTGLAYDQRNAVVVGLAMGFAVIPIIFAIAEDAFSNVPRNLVSGSLALGATRWQTVTRVVLPTASPGIFSAIMVGFGRAVGETMIVLMATGNTPIMSWNPFNGFRTLSANIAVEIPEAPHGGTLYRTLFLAALLLFVVTFVVNTAAEIVRQRLRRRYAEL